MRYADIWIVWARTFRFQILLTDAVSGKVIRIETRSGPMSRHEPTGPRGVFQVTQQISDEHSWMSTEPDKNCLELGILAQRLRKMVQQPAPENSETIDIEQLLRRLLPVDTKIEETKQPKLEAEGVDDGALGNVA